MKEKEISIFSLHTFFVGHHADALLLFSVGLITKLALADGIATFNILGILFNEALCGLGARFTNNCKRGSNIIWFIFIGILGTHVVLLHRRHSFRAARLCKHICPHYCNWPKVVCTAHPRDTHRPVRQLQKISMIFRHSNRRECALTFLEALVLEVNVSLAALTRACLI